MLATDLSPLNPWPSHLESGDHGNICSVGRWLGLNEAIPISFVAWCLMGGFRPLMVVAAVVAGETFH